MVSITGAELRMLVNEALGALRMLDILKAEVVVSGSNRKVKVEEILTDIRTIKGVATVTQSSAIGRSPTGRRVLDLIITFDAKEMDSIEYMNALGHTIKKIKGVDSVIYHALNERPLLDDSGKRPVY